MLAWPNDYANNRLKHGCSSENLRRLGTCLISAFCHLQLFQSLGALGCRARRIPGFHSARQHRAHALCNMTNEGPAACTCAHATRLHGTLKEGHADMCERLGLGMQRCLGCQPGQERTHRSLLLRGAPDPPGSSVSQQSRACVAPARTATACRAPTRGMRRKKLTLES